MNVTLGKGVSKRCSFLAAVIVIILMCLLTACSDASTGDDSESNGGPLKLKASSGMGTPGTSISKPLDARDGVVRILAIDDAINPTQFATGSGFGVGIVGEETAVFLTNRHVIWDESADKVAEHIYIMLDDNAAKQIYTMFGEFYDEEAGQPFKLLVNQDRLVECDVLYPTGNDPEYPDLAIIRADRKIEDRVALPLLSADEVEDSSDVWTIGYPGSADKIYNTSSSGREMFYSADSESAELFTGTISRRGKMHNLGDTMALTHSAQIDHGNSGGPLVEEHGSVVGINTYGYLSAETSSVGYYCSIYIDYGMEKLKELGIPYNIEPGKANSSDRSALEGADSSSVPETSTSHTIEAKPGMMLASMQTKTEEYDEDGNMECTYTHTYNEYGEWTGIAKHDQYGKQVYRTEFILDDRGERIKQQRYNSDDSKGEWSEHTYDEDGRELSYRSYDENGVMDAWCDYSYDKNGTPTKEEFHYSTGSIEYTYYSDKGKKEKRVQVDENGDIEEVSEYDGNGEVTSHIEYNDDGSVRLQTSYEYDQEGNETLYLYQKGDYFRGRKYTYDEDGNVLEEIEFDEDANIISVKQYVHYVDAYECVELNGNGDITAYEVHYEDNFGWGTFKHDPDGNLIESKKYIYDYDQEGYLVGEGYYRDEVLKSYDYYELAEVRINPNEPEDYISGGRSTRRRDDEFSMTSDGPDDDK